MHGTTVAESIDITTTTATCTDYCATTLQIIISFLGETVFPPPSCPIPHDRIWMAVKKETTTTRKLIPYSISRNSNSFLYSVCQCISFVVVVCGGINFCPSTLLRLLRFIWINFTFLGKFKSLKSTLGLKFVFLYIFHIPQGPYAGLEIDSFPPNNNPTLTSSVSMSRWWWSSLVSFSSAR